uniref:Uncharacterized protein n=1 Tax=Arion vulgaris TaxID=1028688 RepID=A0A0B6Y4M1_9EUPU
MKKLGRHFENEKTLLNWRKWEDIAEMKKMRRLLQIKNMGRYCENEENGEDC